MFNDTSLTGCFQKQAQRKILLSSLELCKEINLIPRCDIDDEYFPAPGKASSSPENLSAEDAELLAALRELASEDALIPILPGRFLGL